MPTEPALEGDIISAEDAAFDGELLVELVNVGQKAIVMNSVPTSVIWVDGAQPQRIDDLVHTVFDGAKLQLGKRSVQFVEIHTIAPTISIVRHQNHFCPC